MKDQHSMNPFAVVAWILAMAAGVVWLILLAVLYNADAYHSAEERASMVAAASALQTVLLASLPVALILSGLRWLTHWQRTLPVSQTAPVVPGLAEADPLGTPGPAEPGSTPTGAGSGSAIS